MDRSLALSDVINDGSFVGFGLGMSEAEVRAAIGEPEDRSVKGRIALRGWCRIGHDEHSRVKYRYKPFRASHSSFLSSLDLIPSVLSITSTRSGTSR